MGQTVGVTITVDERPGVLEVPSVAILDLGEGPVLTVVRDGKTVVAPPGGRDVQGGWVRRLGNRPQGGRAGDRRGRLQPSRRDAGELKGNGKTEGASVKAGRPKDGSEHEE